MNRKKIITALLGALAAVALIIVIVSVVRSGDKVTVGGQMPYTYKITSDSVKISFKDGDEWNYAEPDDGIEIEKNGKKSFTVKPDGVYSGVVSFSCGDENDDIHSVMIKIYSNGEQITVTPASSSLFKQNVSLNEDGDLPLVVIPVTGGAEVVFTGIDPCEWQTEASDGAISGGVYNDNDCARFSCSFDGEGEYEITFSNLTLGLKSTVEFSVDAWGNVTALSAKEDECEKTENEEKITKSPEEDDNY